MEKKIQSQIDNSFEEFKLCIINNIKNNTNKEDIINIINSYESLKLTHDDFKKRKRVKNNVPLYDRCCACRANGEQCTRKKHTSYNFCGTHIKGTPHGIISNITEPNNTQKIEIRTQDVKGIVYYIDNSNNVYDPSDILKNIDNPKIIAQYKLDDNNDYSIQS
tara:strand:- start:291 stop:779 length:489 start_codon:yes stop_codon:yes gene_type:complete